MMKRAQFVGAAAATAAATSLRHARAESTQYIAGIPIPSSALALEAMEIGRMSLPSAIFNHCLRTFAFAELIAREQGWAHDAELVYVASILHDTGLSLSHMSDHERFEVDGARVAQTLMDKHGVSKSRQELVWDAITLHDNGGLARWKAREVAIVNMGVSADFGSSQDILRQADIVSVLKAAPRAGFIDVFLPAVAEVARRKPYATGACFVTDVGYRLVAGFHLDNFCDEVRNDPFKGFDATRS